MPAPLTQDGHIVRYDLKVESDKTTVHVERKLDVNVLLLELRYYNALRNFFQDVRTADDEQVLLQPGTASASK